MKFMHLAAGISTVIYTSSAWAAPSPTPTIDPETALNNALSIGASLPGALGAVFVAVILLAWAAFKIAAYFTDKNARETQAYTKDLQVQQTQAENLARMQADASNAFISAMDAAYKEDYNTYLAGIKSGDFTAIYLKNASEYHEQIASFIYDNTIPPEQRAARIILLVRPTVPVVSYSLK